MGDLTANFSLTDFRDKETNPETPVPRQYHANVRQLAENLQVLRDHLDKPVYVNCGYRTAGTNAKYKRRASKSNHLLAMAADIHVKEMTAADLYDAIKKLIDEKKMHDGGLMYYPLFVHYDVRKTAWRSPGP
jgi:uncharacterized protein YcbK (DUF882 family)